MGIAPFCRRTFRYRGGLTFRRLELLGADVDTQDGVCSEYLGLITPPHHEAQVADAFVRELSRGGFGPWDEVVLSSLDGASSLTRRLIDAFVQHELPCHVEETTTAPYVSLPDTWEAFLKQLSKSKRWNLKTQLKDFELWAAGQAQWHEARTSQELETAWRILRDLHEVRWTAEGKKGVFASARFTRFHERFLHSRLEQGKQELVWLSVAGRPVAALYAFREAGTVYFYQSGRVMDVPDKVRLGSVIVAQAIRRAIERGDKEFDLLGDPARYKLSFTATTRPLIRIRVARPTFKEWLRRAGAATLRGWRRIKTWWKRSAASEQCVD